MKHYFLLSLFLHLLVLLPLNLTGRLDLNNFYSGRSAARAGFLAVGLLDEGGPGAAAQTGTAFIGVEELSAYADPQNRPPQYPALALRNRWQGETVLLLSINEDGVLDEVDLVKPSGYKVLDEAALQAAQTWRFASPRRSIQVNFPVRFTLE